jgi:hypothetical protein
MKSRVAEEVRAAHQADVMALTPGERVELSFRLGEQAVANLAAARGISREEALKIIRQQSQHGRRPSACMEERDDEPLR